MRFPYCMRSITLVTVVTIARLRGLQVISLCQAQKQKLGASSTLYYRIFILKPHRASRFGQWSISGFTLQGNSSQTYFTVGHRKATKSYGSTSRIGPQVVELNM